MSPTERVCCANALTVAAIAELVRRDNSLTSADVSRMVARAALTHLRAAKGSEAAAEAAYRLADELAVTPG